MSPEDAMLHQEYQVDGLCVHSWTGPTADPGRPVLLALHGWSDDGAVFGPLASRIVDVCDVVAPDAPGHGRSPWAGSGRFGFDRLVDPTVTVLQHVAEETAGRPLVLFGHSMGANVAMNVASAHPGLLAHLVLEEPAHLPRLALLERRKDRLWRRRLQAAGHEARVREIQRLASWSLQEADVWADALGRADLEVLATLPGYRPLVRLLDVTVPVPTSIVVGGGARSWQADRVLRRCLTACTGPTEVIRVGQGHNPRREETEVFLQVIRGVVQSVTPQAEPRSTNQDKVVPPRR